MASSSDDLLTTIVKALRSNADVKAAWLAGSRGRGTADDFSDIDIWIAVDDDAMPPIIDDPLAFIRTIAPTFMHILAPSIAPPGGSFIGVWVPLADGFEQVDWYIAPASSATREEDTTIIFGEVPVHTSVESPAIHAIDQHARASENLVFTLQMVNNMIKHGRRGDFWLVVQHAVHGVNCLNIARSVMTTGSNPGYLAAKRPGLPEPPPVSVREVWELALTLVQQVEDLDAQLGDHLGEAIAALRAHVESWRDSDWKPTEEYYRTLPRKYVGAGMLFTDIMGNVLLVETTYKESFEIPGGVVEPGESPRAAARRETQEELGLSIEPGSLLIVDTRSQPAPKGDAIAFVFDGGMIDNPSAIQPDKREIARVHFVPADRLESVCTPRMATRLRAAIRARYLNRTVEIIDGEVVT